MNQQQFFKTQLKELIEECLHGLMHFRTWQRLNQTFERDADIIEIAVHFFMITSIAHLNSASLHLFRIIDKTKSASSIFKLIKYAETYKEIFKKQEILENAIAKHTKLLNSLEPKIQNINKQRNKHIIHKSKEYLDKGYDKLYQEYSVAFKDYEILFEAFSTILNDYLWLLEDGKQTSFEVQGEDEEFEDLILCLRKGIETMENENL